MITLLIKDFRLMFSKGRGGAKGILRALLSALFLACFVALEIFLFSQILDRIKDYSNAPMAFMLLFLLVISVFMMVSGIFQAKKLFFNEQDIAQLANHPVSNSKMILSKMIFLFAVHYATALLFEYPIFIAYGTIFNKSVWFYYKALFYPLLASLFELGVSLLLVYPVWMLLQYLKKHVALEFTLSVALIFSLAYPYSKILDVFVGLVTNNELNLLFSEASMNAIASLGEYAIPINFLVDVFVMQKNTGLFPYLAIAGGIFFLGLTLTVFTFHKVRNITANSKAKVRKRAYRRHGQVYGLIKKEIILLTKNPDYIFSYSGLLLVQPFLLYLIVMAMNAIFGSGIFLVYSMKFPNFVALVDVFLVMMVALIINSGANQYITIEERTIKNLKTIPVGYKKQLAIKMLIPFTLSVLFLLVSLIVLWMTDIMTLQTAGFSFLLTTVVLFVFDVVSLCEELNIRHGKPRSTYMSSLYSYVLPFAYIILVMVLSYNELSLLTIYLLGIALFALLGLPHIIRVTRRMGDWFMELEAIN